MGIRLWTNQTPGNADDRRDEGYIKINYGFSQKILSDRQHTLNFCLEMGKAKNVFGKNVFCSMNKEKIIEERIFETVHCPFEGRAKLHHLCQPNGPVGRC